ncbi:MAG: glycine cleavage T C-terminal barrel domain-containing protein [Microthrixaceae bacterium]
MNDPQNARELIAAIGPRVRKSPFFEATVDAGLRAVSTYNHMWLPMSYGDPEGEYRRLTEGVSMWDVAAQRHLEVSGPDADELVQLVTVVDTSEVPRGSGRYAPMVDHSGTLINDPVLLRFDDGSWRFSIADADVRLWLDAVAHGRGLDCTVTELDTATMAVQGPLAGDVLGALGCDDLGGLADFERRSATLEGIDVIVSRSGWSNQGGYELFLDDTDRALELWAAVADAGRRFDIGPGAPNPSERLENVLLSYGTDTGYGATPIELGMTDLIGFAGYDFIGRSALLTQRDSGRSRRLVGVRLDGAPIDPLPNPVPLTLDGDEHGQLRSAAWSPRFSTNLGLALVPAGDDPGTVGRTTIAGRTHRAELVGLPFADSLDER